MAKKLITESRITNCFACHWNRHGYEQRGENGRYNYFNTFWCQHPYMPADIGFGVKTVMPRAENPAHYPKVREDHTKSIGNIKIPPQCPLDDIE